METIQAEPVADGQQPITSADVVCKVLCVHQARPPPREAATTFFWRMFVSRQAPPEQRHRRRECFGNSLLLNRKVLLSLLIKTERELEEYKKWQQEEYNNLHELCTRFNTFSNSQSSTPAAWCSEHLWFNVWTHVPVGCVDLYAGLMCWYYISG